MLRSVLFASVGILALHPASAQETATATLSSPTKPGSSIAQSQFALAQRDAARQDQAVVRPNLQVTTPVGSQLPKPAGVTTSGLRRASTPKSTPLILPPPTLVVPQLSVPVPTPPVPSVVTALALPQKAPISLNDKKGDAASVVAKSAPVLMQPKTLASREALRQRSLLSQLDSDLAAAQPKLSRAQARLAESQHQLGAFTSVLRSAMMEAGDEGNGLHPFVRVAQRYLGTPYVWGGESARGFDCSGFIMRVMRDLGYRALPHSAAEQFRYGLPVARELLKPGDVVFFANTYKPGVSHVGIYLGKRHFIHAANSKVGTIISSIDDPKWVEHYAGARRLIRVN